jgi:hypothetical protein
LCKPQRRTEHEIELQELQEHHNNQRSEASHELKLLIDRKTLQLQLQEEDYNGDNVRGDNVCGDVLVGDLGVEHKHLRIRLLKGGCSSPFRPR